MSSKDKDTSSWKAYDVPPPPSPPQEMSVQYT